MMPGPRVQQILQNESPSRSAVAGELVRAHEITHVLDALAARRVFPILMKGAALAYSLYPSPAMRFLYIQPDEIYKIREMIILNTVGQIVETVAGEKLQDGWINIDHLNPGAYIAVLKYEDGSLVNKKFLKE